MGMNGMSSMSMSMPTTATSASTMPSASNDMDMGGMGMGGDDACKISMLWNWYTIDACFLSEQWHIRSAGMMAGSCIGVIALVMLLEALRRGAREYDAYIARTHLLAQPFSTTAVAASSSSDDKNGAAVQTTAPLPQQARSFTPTLPQQLVRAVLHMCQFAVAYFVMLLAMYFNGYIILCIFVGAFLGAFVFSWHRLNLP